MHPATATVACLFVLSTGCHVSVRLEATTSLGRSCIAECRGKSERRTGYQRLGQYSEPDPVDECVERCPDIAAADGVCTVSEEAQDRCFQSERLSFFRSVAAAGAAAVGGVVFVLLALLASCGGDCFA